MFVCAGVVRLEGMPTDAERLGDLVWAKDATKDSNRGCWWPGEVRTSSAPSAAHVDFCSREERMHTLQSPKYLINATLHYTIYI